MAGASQVTTKGEPAMTSSEVLGVKIGSKSAVCATAAVVMARRAEAEAKKRILTDVAN